MMPSTIQLHKKRSCSNECKLYCHDEDIRVFSTENVGFDEIYKNDNFRIYSAGYKWKIYTIKIPEMNEYLTNMVMDSFKNIS